MPDLSVFAAADKEDATAVIDPGRVVVPSGDLELNAGKPKHLLRVSTSVFMALIFLESMTSKWCDLFASFNFCFGVTRSVDRQLNAHQVCNTGDRPVQVGSHYHFIESNPCLEFDRKMAHKCRLNIPSGSAIRFEPGEEKTVSLVPIGGNQLITGGNGLCQAGGTVDEIVQRAVAQGFAHAEQTAEALPSADGLTLSDRLAAKISRAMYADIYGPTVGDRVRLGNTDLYVVVEEDMCAGPGVGYGSELKFGGGKTIRDGMAQCSSVLSADALDLVITNALILDYTGVYKADIGIKNGLIHGIGRGGNPDCMDGVHPDMVVGSTTEVVAGEVNACNHKTSLHHIYLLSSS